MQSSQPLRVPIGHDAQRWSTFHGERTVVAAVRTVTSATRILETLPTLLRDDPRITLVFAYDPTSAFNEGVLDLLRDSGCRIMPWEQLGWYEPDLIVSASENINVPEGECPVLVLPHGVGFQKYVPDSRTPHTRLSGVVPDALLEAGRAWLAVSHPDQEAQLLASHPKTAGHTLLVGDPCFDELHTSLPRKARYRRALGVPDRHRLVVVSSTWGGTSLLGRHSDLPTRLLAELPYDAYRVAAIVHPNVWSAHGAWELRRLLASALDSGLILLPPVHTWRAGLVAADLVVGDHGSVTLYGAALGKPVLLAAFGDDAVPGTAIAALGARTPHLDPEADLHDQVERVAEGHDPDRSAELTTRHAFAEPGHALPRLRASLYRLLRLPEPTHGPAPLRVLPEAEQPATEVLSWTVRCTASLDAERLRIDVHRYPAAATATATATPRETHEAQGTHGTQWAHGTHGTHRTRAAIEASEAHETGNAPDTHLACRTDEPDRRLTESASVLLHERPSESASAGERWIRDTLARFPGCLLAATQIGDAYETGATWVGIRDAGTVEAAGVAAGAPAPAPAWAAAAVYTCLRAGRRPEGTVVTLRLSDGRDLHLTLRTPPPDASP
ncbi:hypothetical protein [Streptomyces sp. NPDC002851]